MIDELFDGKVRPRLSSAVHIHTEDFRNIWREEYAVLESFYVLRVREFARLFLISPAGTHFKIDSESARNQNTSLPALSTLEYYERNEAGTTKRMEGITWDMNMTCKFFELLLKATQFGGNVPIFFRSNILKY